MSIGSFLTRHSGVTTLFAASSDVHLIMAMRCVRLSAFGSISLILVQFLKTTGIADTELGMVITITVLGDLLSSFVLASISDALGRRKVLLLSSIVMTLSGISLYFIPKNIYLIAIVLFLGIISPSGSECGPFRSIEQSSISSLCKLEDRSDVFSWYTFVGNVSSGLGNFLIGHYVTETD